MTNQIRLVFVVTVLVALAGCASREKTVPPDAVRADTVDTAATTGPPYQAEIEQPVVIPPEAAKTSVTAVVETGWKGAADGWKEAAEKWQHAANEWKRIADGNLRIAREFEAKVKECEERCGQAGGPVGYPGPVSDAATEDVPSSQAVMMQAVAMDTATATTPARERQAVAITINADPRVKRMNLALLPTYCHPMAQLWADQKFRNDVRVGADGKFPVRLWRSRKGTVAFVVEVRVQAGPGLTTGVPQFQLNPNDWQFGDVLLIEWTPALLVAVGGQCVSPMVGYGIDHPRLSIIEPTSNDPTPPSGSWTTFEGEPR